MSNLASNADVKELRKRIAALEAALERAQAAMWDAHYGNGIVVEYAQTVDREIRQALTSSEGAGECPHGCVAHEGSRLIKRPEWGPGAYEPCPIHSPTSAAEDREDG